MNCYEILLLVVKWLTVYIATSSSSPDSVTTTFTPIYIAIVSLGRLYTVYIETKLNDYTACK